jgi:hypothetical protein
MRLKLQTWRRATWLPADTCRISDNCQSTRQSIQCGTGSCSDLEVAVTPYLHHGYVMIGTLGKLRWLQAVIQVRQPVSI